MEWLQLREWHDLIGELDSQAFVPFPTRTNPRSGTLTLIWASGLLIGVVATWFGLGQWRLGRPTKDNDRVATLVKESFGWKAVREPGTSLARWEIPEKINHLQNEIQLALTIGHTGKGAIELGLVDGGGMIHGEIDQYVQAGCEVELSAWVLIPRDLSREHKLLIVTVGAEQQATRLVEKQQIEIWRGSRNWQRVVVRKKVSNAADLIFWEFNTSAGPGSGFATAPSLWIDDVDITFRSPQPNVR